MTRFKNSKFSYSSNYIWLAGKKPAGYDILEKEFIFDRINIVFHSLSYCGEPNVGYSLLYYLV